MFHLLCCSGVDEGPLGGAGLRPVTHTKLSVHRLTHLLHELTVDGALHQEAVGADARLQRRSFLMTVSLSSKRTDPLQAAVTCPEFLNLDTMAPRTAWSTSALSNTMKGAWPPSSMDVRFTVSAASFSSI